MSLKKLLKIRHTLAFRLTLMYATVFAVSSFGAFFIFYIMITNVIQERTDQILLNDLAELSSILLIKGDDSFRSEMQIEAEADGVEKIFLRLLDATGREISASNMSFWKGVYINRSALKRIMGGENHILETVSVPGRPYKARILYGNVGPGKLLQIGMSLEDDTRFLAAFKEVFVPVMVLIMFLSALIGWFMARRALTGVEEVTKTAVDISEGAFDKRVYIKTRDDEIKQLAMAFNRMLDRINDLVKGLREVTDNIAHDIKTPITRIRGLAESELNSGGGGYEGHKLAADTVEECDSLLQMINTMLKISETETRIDGIAREQVDLALIIGDAVELFRPVAEEKGVSLTSRVSGSVCLRGDIHSLQRMIVNILENAVKYTDSGGSVTVSCRDDNNHVIVTIEDTGIGISREDLPRIFKRLYRCDRSRSQPGFGLGLSLAQAIAEVHGGRIVATSHPGKGSTFEVTLPR
jgi:heavy metal sensor kinase